MNAPPADRIPPRLPRLHFRLGRAWPLALVAASCASAVLVFRPAPASLNQTPAEPAPLDVAQPMAQVVWTMRNDMRAFDGLWRWLQDEVPPSPERDRAVGAAALLGAAELDRADVIETGVAAFDRAISAFPEDARLPIWKEFVASRPGFWAGNTERTQAAYERLRAASAEYPQFTLFGITLAVAADRHASDALIQEALDAYEVVLDSSNELQFLTSDKARMRGPRVLGDWHSAPYNLPGTLALRGDLAARAGDLELARESYHMALRTNAGFRWLWYDEVQRKLASVDALAERIAAGEEPMLGARYRAALGVDAADSVPRADGRIGNGSCTLCHSALSAVDVGLDPPPLGWVHVRAKRPKGVITQLPVFVALPEASETATPLGFSVGAVDLPGYPVSGAASDTFETLVPAPPGMWLIAGQIQRNGDETYSTFTSKTLGLPRFIEVRAGEVTELQETLSWTR